MSASSTLLSRFEDVRQATAMLAEPLSDEDCGGQSMTDASPVKWHLAHTTWFFETFVLERFEPAFRPFHPAFRMLFNSYYNGVGDQYPRSQRGLITRPGMDEVWDYRADVDARITALLLVATSSEQDSHSELQRLIELGLQHEQQHQELILTDVQHLLWHNPLHPAYYGQPLSGDHPQRNSVAAAALQWLPIEGGVVQVGNSGEGFQYDNELPRHRQYLEPYALASRLVSNADYQAFVDAGGYRDPSLWLSEGWAWLNAGARPITHPLYWERYDDTWHEFSLYGLQPLQAECPATHLCYFEADAYARWAGARLPTEAEWEHATATTPNGGLGHDTADGHILEQLFDAAWQWTCSSYAPYPGYAPQAGAIGEYNGKFMVNQYVLRGGSRLTPPGHTRPSYRNFFPAHARWQCTGIRLARSL